MLSGTAKTIQLVHTSASKDSRHVDRFNHDEDADGYDADVLNQSDPIRTGYQQALEWVVQQVPSDKTQRVLELGSGTGNLTQMIARSLKSSAITCVDISSEMTALAQGKLEPLGGDYRLHFVLRDVLGFCRDAPEDSYDCVVSTYTLHHLEHDEKAVLFRELNRVLAPQGKFLVADLMFESSGDAELILQDYRQRGLVDLAEEISDEFFWNLSADLPRLSAEGFETETARFSELSWGISAKRN